MPAVEFYVAGQPGTKGSVRAFVTRPKRPGLAPRAVVVRDSKRCAPWSAAVSEAARAALAAPFPGAVVLEIEFRFARPRAHYLRSGLRPNAPRFVSVKPDGDKLERATWDALTGIAFSDDSRIARWTGSKVYTDDGSMGARIKIAPLDEVAP